MRIGALTTSTGYHLTDLQRAAVRRGHTLDALQWTTLRDSVGVKDAVLTNYDALLLRPMGASSLEQIIFRMDCLARLASQGLRIVNPPRTIEIAADKYLALSRIADAGLPVPATVVCESRADAVKAVERFGDAVIKPLFGAQGHGLSRITSGIALPEPRGGVYYIQQFIDHGGSDLRLFVIGSTVIAAMRRHSDNWRTNIAQGARGEAVEPDTTLCNIAIAAAQACDCAVAGVDIVQDREGKPYVLEVNASPGWEALAAVTGIDIADHIIAHLEDSHANPRPTRAASVHR